MTDSREPITTPRLRLRLFTEDDEQALFDLHADPEGAKFLSREVRSREEVRAVIARRSSRTRFAVTGDGLVLAIERASDGMLIGECSLWLREDRAGEIGSAIAPEHRGQGYAREAAAAVLDLAARTGLIDVVYGTVDRGNHASIRLLTKLGLMEHPTIAGDEHRLRFSTTLSSQAGPRKA